MPFDRPVYRDCSDPSCPFCHPLSEEDRLDAEENASRNFFKWTGFLLLGLFFGTLLFFAAVILAPAARGQTLPTTAPAATRPAGRIPVCSWFQPKRNLQMLHDQGVWLHFGPEVENARALPLAQLQQKEDEWIAEVERLGDRCVLKRPRVPLSRSCVGLLTELDEPNRTGGIPPSRVRDNAAQLRANFPGVDVYVSLAGDQITNIKPTDRDLAQKVATLGGYLEAADVVTYDVYPANRNAARYRITREHNWTRDVAEVVHRYYPGKRLIAWVEMNDQVVKPIPTPADGYSRAPTPQEIEDQVEGALDAGVEGFGWFATSQSNAYGWGRPGDSYWPLVDRNGVSLLPQLDRVLALSRKYGRPVDPELAAARAKLLEVTADRDAKAALIQRARDVLAPAATQPTQ